MQKFSYRRYRFHPDIIQQAVWLYFRFTMSYRDVEVRWSQKIGQVAKVYSAG